MAQTNENESQKIVELKVSIYEVLERQSLLANENQRLEQVKTELSKKLAEAREEAAAESKAESVAE
jgi:hypothetical protein